MTQALAAADSLHGYDFELPPTMVAADPPEVHGRARDDVRMMVTNRGSGGIWHRRLPELADVLESGDLLIVNTSLTIPAALGVRSPQGISLAMHLSTQLPGDLWTVELRRDGEPYAASPGRLALPGAAHAHLHAPYIRRSGGSRLWIASLHTDEPIFEYLSQHGRPISYGKVVPRWGIDRYQTIFATTPGSAEMPSAGRAFTHELVTRLVSRGVGLAPILLHTGVSSLEVDEPPYEEQYSVSPWTAATINSTRAFGGRVIAVGTTVVRALETVVDAAGTVHPGSGWTDVVIGADRPVRAIDGLLTGWHEPRASHLLMVEAVAGRDLLERAYESALQQRYLWHEFGDLHLILP